MPRKILTPPRGGLVDESLKARTELLLVDFSHRIEILEALKVLFGEYRCLTQSRNTEPSRAESIRHAEKTVKLINELKEHLDDTPESINAQIGLHRWRLNREIEAQPLGRIHEELDSILMSADRAVTDAKGWKSKTGERPKCEEHELLSEVASILESSGLAKNAAADLASQILRSEGVRVPEDPAKAREVILATRKKQHP